MNKLHMNQFRNLKKIKNFYINGKIFVNWISILHKALAKKNVLFIFSVCQFFSFVCNYFYCNYRK